MPSTLAHASEAQVRVRKAGRGDLDALMALEHRVFATDRLSRRSIRHFLTSPTAEVIVAQEEGGRLAGTAIVLFHPRSATARLYSIAVAPHMGGRGWARCCSRRLKTRPSDMTAARSGSKCITPITPRSRATARAATASSAGARYYQDGGDALRFEKRLVPRLAALKAPPPYFHQTTEFTCGPACIMMALAWADRSFKPAPAMEFALWREATTIVMGTGPGGCEPYGMAVTLKRHGLEPEIYVSRAGPYFLDTARSADQRRVMQVTQLDFQREAKALDIPSHLTPVSESVLMKAFDSGSVAIVLVSGYHMVARGRPHWIFAFGRDRRHVLMHDPAAIRDDQGMAHAPETYAVPWTAFEPMTRIVTRLGRERLSAAIVIRKGHP